MAEPHRDGTDGHLGAAARRTSKRLLASQRRDLTASKAAPVSRKKLRKQAHDARRDSDRRGKEEKRTAATTVQKDAPKKAATKRKAPTKATNKKNGRQKEDVKAAMIHPRKDKDMKMADGDIRQIAATLAAAIKI